MKILPLAFLALLLLATPAAAQIPATGLVCAEILEVDINGDPAWDPGQRWDRTPTAAFAACGWTLRDAFEAAEQYTWPDPRTPAGCYLAVRLPLEAPRGRRVADGQGGLTDCLAQGYQSRSGWRPRCPILCPAETRIFADGFESGGVSAWAARR